MEKIPASCPWLTTCSRSDDNRARSFAQVSSRVYTSNTDNLPHLISIYRSAWYMYVSQSSQECRECVFSSHQTTHFPPELRAPSNEIAISSHASRRLQCIRLGPIQGRFAAAVDNAGTKPSQNAEYQHPHAQTQTHRMYKNFRPLESNYRRSHPCRC